MPHLREPVAQASACEGGFLYETGFATTDRHFSNSWISASAYSSADLRRLSRKARGGAVALAVPCGHGDELHQFERDFIAVLRRIFCAVCRRILGRASLLFRLVSSDSLPHCRHCRRLLPPAKPMPVNARRFIRKMRGGAQAHLLEADDGDCYIVKFQNNPQHRRILVNEFVAAEILAHLQISCPGHRDRARCRRSFWRLTRKCGCKSGERHIAIAAGLAFRIPAPGQTRIDRDLRFHSRCAAQPGGQCGTVPGGAGVRSLGGERGRAADRIFFRAQLKDWLAQPGVPPRKLGFVALMIDHGFAFNGPHWDFPDSAVTGLYPRRTVYDAVRSVGGLRAMAGTHQTFSRGGFRQGFATHSAGVAGGRRRAAGAVVRVAAAQKAEDPGTGGGLPQGAGQSVSAVELKAPATRSPALHACD